LEKEKQLKREEEEKKMKKIQDKVIKKSKYYFSKYKIK